MRMNKANFIQRGPRKCNAATTTAQLMRTDKMEFYRICILFMEKRENYHKYRSQYTHKKKKSVHINQIYVKTSQQQ